MPSQQIADANTWRAFNFEFDALRNEELSGDPGNRQDRWLRAYSIGSIERWQLSEGLNESFRVRFERLASRAGAALGPAQGPTQLNHWLYRVYLELKKSRSKLLFAPSGEIWRPNKDNKPVRRKKKVGIIRSVCEASAIYSARLEMNAVNQQRAQPSSGRKPKHLRTERTALHNAQPGETKADLLGKKRASLVAKLIGELNAIARRMQVPDDDYPKLRDENPKYAVFKICKKHPSASDLVKRVCDRRSVNQLAYELAGIEFSVRPATIETAWKRYKPKAGRLK